MNLIPKVGTVEKRLLLGGVANSLTYWANVTAEAYLPQYPPELKDRLEEHLPTNGELIADLAPPAILYVAQKVAKSGTTKEKLGDVGFGAMLYAFPNLMAKTGSRAAYVEGTKVVPAVAVARVPTTYKVSAVAPKRTVAPTVGKYRVTA